MDIFTDVVEKYKSIGLDLEVESIGLQECYRLKVNNDREMIIPFEVIHIYKENSNKLLVNYITKFFESILEEEKKKTP